MSPQTSKPHDVVQEIVQETASIKSEFVRALKVAQIVQQKRLSIAVHETVLKVIERDGEEQVMERFV